MDLLDVIIRESGTIKYEVVKKAHEEEVFKRALERSPEFIREDKDFVKWIKRNENRIIALYRSYSLAPFPSKEFDHYKFSLRGLALFLNFPPLDELPKELIPYVQRAFFFLEVMFEEGRIHTWNKKRLESFIQFKSSMNEQKLQETMYHRISQVLSHNRLKYTELLGVKYVFLALGELKEEFNGVVNQEEDINDGLKGMIKNLIENFKFLDIYLETANKSIKKRRNHFLDTHYKLFKNKLFDILGKQDKELKEQKKREIYALFDIADGLSRRWVVYNNNGLYYYNPIDTL